MDAGFSGASLVETGIECPMPRFSRFHVLYSGNPTPPPGRKFRQIVAGPSEDRTFYEVRIFEGDSVQKDPDFNAVRGMEYYSHDSAEAADKDADQERDRSVAAGWVLFDPSGR
jgi:hypothetical protein